MRWGIASCSMVLAGCVVVAEPDVELAGSSGLASSGSSVASSGGTSSESASSSSAGESGDAPPIESPEYEVVWAVSPSSVVPPAGSAGTIRTDLHVVVPVSFGAHPGSISDRDAFYEAVEAGVEAAISEADSGGLGLLPRPGWMPAWCANSDEVQAGFAASPYGEGLSGADLEAAFEAEALELLTQVATRARALRPNVKWGFPTVPAPEYWKIVERDADASYEPWRTCNVSSAVAREVWEVVDFTAPELRYFYATSDDGEYNPSYVSRWVEAMRLAGKPVYPLVGGRFLSSNGELDDSPYIGLPYYAEDVELILTELRAAGAAGLIYTLDADGCWDLDADCTAPPPADLQAAVDDYWMTFFSPVLARFDEE